MVGIVERELFRRSHQLIEMPKKFMVFEIAFVVLDKGVVPQGRTHVTVFPERLTTPPACFQFPFVAIKKPPSPGTRAGFFPRQHPSFWFRDRCSQMQELSGRFSEPRSRFPYVEDLDLEVVWRQPLVGEIGPQVCRFCHQEFAIQSAATLF